MEGRFGFVPLDARIFDPEVSIPMLAPVRHPGSVEQLDPKIEAAHLAVFLEVADHQRTEFTVEVAKKEQGLFAENRKARVMNLADDVRRPKQPRHQWWKLFRQCLRIRRQLQGKAEGEVVLVHCVISFTLAAESP